MKLKATDWTELMSRTCADCATDISARHFNAYLCQDCARRRERSRRAAWNQAHRPRTERYRTYHRLYERARRIALRIRAPRQCATATCTGYVAYRGKQFCPDCALFFRTNQIARRGRGIVALGGAMYGEEVA